MHHINPHSNQSGVALIIGLIMLISMTLIGLAGARMTTTEEKMSSNLKDTHMAFEAAEASLIAAENDIETNVVSTSIFDTNGADGFYDNSFENIWQLVDWDGTDTANTNEAKSYSSFDTTYKIRTAPKYVIQHYATVVSNEDTLNLDNYGQGTGAGNTEMFRITARGTGGSDNSVVVLQTTYGKRL